MNRRKPSTISIILKNLITVLTVVAIVVVLIFLIQGWIINPDGKTVQTGLVQFATNVSGSTVQIDEKTLSEKTTTKYQVVPGKYTFKMTQEGYEPWSRTASVGAGEILWLNYARLIPKNKTTESFFDIENLKTIKFSQNKQKIFAISQDASGFAKFWLIDLGENPKTTEIILPEKLFERSLAEGEKHLSNIAGNISIEGLSENASRAILKWKNGENYEWLAVNLTDAEKSNNLTDEFSLNFSKIAARDKGYTKFYALANNELREINTENSTISAKILDGIIDFDIYSENILSYVKSENSVYSVGIFENGGKTTLVAQNLSAQPKIAIGRYYSENYIHVLSEKTLKIYKGNEWFGNNQPKIAKTLSLDFDAENIDLNSEMRILKISSSQKTVNYDLETSSKYEISNGNLRWLDDFVLYDYENEKITVRDFDGSNKYSIFEALSEFGISLSRDEKYIYGFKKNSSGNFELVRVKMIIS